MIFAVKGRLIRAWRETFRRDEASKFERAHLQPPNVQQLYKCIGDDPSKPIDFTEL